MKTRQILVLAIGIFILFLSSSSTSTDTIYWSDSYKLNWNDFKAYPNYELSNVSALSSSGIVHSSGCKNGKIIYDVKSYFEKRESWVKDEARTNYHLAHEQLHFDITELYARKLRKALSTKQFRCGEEPQFEAYVKEFIHDWHQEQHNYDSTSQHSMNKEVQQEWLTRIAIELEEMEEYAY